MDKERYKNMNKQMKPSHSLINQTKNLMKVSIHCDELQKEGSLNQSSTRRSDMKRKINYGRLAIVVVIVFFIGCINLSSTFAATLENIPVIGQLVQVLTLRSYVEKDDDKTITVNQPVVSDPAVKESESQVSDSEKENETSIVEGTTENNEESATDEASKVSETIIDINLEIEKAIASYKEEAEIRIAEYKEAFIATGGSEEGFAGKDIQVVVDYDVVLQTDQYLSFTLGMYEDWNSASAVTQYYNLDGKTGEIIEISDLLGEDYIEVANKIILEEIIETNNNSEYPPYFSVEEGGFGGFETISETPQFYINEVGNPVIVFNKYEVAPGASGRPEFEIERTVEF